MPDHAASERRSTGRFAFLVAAGIFLSRIAGLIRQRVLAHYFGGSSLAGDALLAAIRIPNLLQNLFGEGVLSASFIPVYANLLARGDEKEANRVAGAVASLLALVTSAIVLAGVLAAPLLVDAIVPGFEGEQRDLTVLLVRIMFPGTGLLVLSAWCLGVLNSHKRFFLSYISPVLWNAAIIAALVAFGDRAGQVALAEVAAWGAVAGSALQFGIQLPTVLRLAKGLRLSLDAHSQNVRTIITNFAPVFVGRGVIQISGYIDELLASLLPRGAVSTLSFAQVLYILPISLFGMSVSAAELPAMSSALGTDEEIAAQLRARLDTGLRRIAFFVVPSAMAFFALGDVVIAAFYQTGEFSREHVLYAWATLAGWTAGLLAATLARLYSSTFYALKDTRTPLKYALVHVALSTALGYAFALPLPPALGIHPRWGLVGLTGAASIAVWVELVLLRRALNRRIGRTGLPLSYAAKLWTVAGAGAAAAWGVKLAIGALHPIPLAALVLGPYGLVYFVCGWALGVPEANALFGRFARLAGRARR